MTSGTTQDIADRWLSCDEIASYLGVKRDTIYKWIDRKNCLRTKSDGSGNSANKKSIQMGVL